MTERAVSPENTWTSLTIDDSATTNISGSSPSEDNFYRGKSAAGAEGAAVVDGLRSGVLATIDACVKALVARTKFKGDKQAIDDFLAPLVEVSILSSSEARLGLASPKLSKLCKIGEYADLLRHELIIRYFFQTDCSGYGPIYQVTVLLDQMPTDLGNDERVQRLVETLERGQVDTLHAMRRLTKQFKDAKRGVSVKLPNSVDARLPDQISVGETGHPPSVHVEDGSDLVLAMPDRSDLRKLREGYVNPPRCLKVGEAIADNAVVIVVATLSDLAVIQYYFLPYFGFEGLAPRLLLSQPPAGPEVTEAQVFIVAERPSGNRARLSEIVWPAGDEPIDPLALAARLVPDAWKKLALFASENADGWQSIVGDANWGQVDG